jgi:putative peptidoglycan lipid II flippase
MLKSSGAMAAATLSSRLLGMVREIVYARFMGDDWVAGAFQMAFQIPNLFRRLLGEGALTAAFIPIFKEKEKTAGDIEMWRAANAVISGMIVAATALIGLGILGISLALAIGHGYFEADTDLMLRLLRVMFPYMLIICLTAVFMGMLNSRGHFFVPALGAAVLNVVMIASVLFLAPCMGRELHEQVYALAIGALVAGVAQAAFQLPGLRSEGFRYHWVSPWKNDTVQRVVRQMIPGTIGVAAFQLNVLITQGLAFFIDPKIIASFNYAVRLMELPQGVFGVSLATYLLPTLSGLAAEKNYAGFRDTLRQGIGHLLFINLLASVLLTVQAGPVIRLLFEYGRFNDASTARATLATMCLAPGLIAFSLNNILARAFYALGDTKTPMRISLVTLCMNLLLAASLVWQLRQSGLAIANTVTSAVNTVLLLYALRRKLKHLDFGELRRMLWVGMAGAALAGAIGWAGALECERLLGHAGLGARLAAVFIPGSLACVAYFGFTYWRGLPAAREIIDLALGRILPLLARRHSKK